MIHFPIFREFTKKEIKIDEKRKTFEKPANSNRKCSRQLFVFEAFNTNRNANREGTISGYKITNKTNIKTNEKKKKEKKKIHERNRQFFTRERKSNNKPGGIE